MSIREGQLLFVVEHTGLVPGGTAVIASHTVETGTPRGRIDAWQQSLIQTNTRWARQLQDVDETIRVYPAVHTHFADDEVIPGTTILVKSSSTWERVY